MGSETAEQVDEYTEAITKKKDKRPQRWDRSKVRIYKDDHLDNVYNEYFVFNDPEKNNSDGDTSNLSCSIGSKAA